MKKNTGILLAAVLLIGLLGMSAISALTDDKATHPKSESALVSQTPTPEVTPTPTPLPSPSPSPTATPMPEPEPAPTSSPTPKL